MLLDCGVNAIDKVAYARKKGIGFYYFVTIIDQAITLPMQVAVLDPKRPDCPYPYDELCGCGVDVNIDTGAR